MGWIQQLHKTYEANLHEVGKIYKDAPILLPVCHKSQKAHIDIMLNLQGELLQGRSSLIQGTGKKAAKGEDIIIPCTEKSAAKANGTNPHPLFDNLQYLARDGNTKNREKYQAYMAQLKAWIAWAGNMPSLQAVYTYLQKGCIIPDLIKDGVLQIEEDGLLDEKQIKLLVRFTVIGAETEQLWQDLSLRQSWIDFQEALTKKEGLCYATGTIASLSEISPKNIRNKGDNAKLISSNDTDGFSFRGRFESANEAFQIGKEINEKAHHALRWLIAKQGYINGSQVILSWMVSEQKEAGPMEHFMEQDTIDVLMGKAEGPKEIEEVTTGANFAKQLQLALAGYKGKLDNADRMVIMGMDSATPGRLSIFYYSEIPAKELVTRLEYWHTSCTWEQWYIEDNKTQKVFFTKKPFPNAPKPKNIVQEAYGKTVNEKLLRWTLQRILPCIAEGAPFPEDIMQSVVARATNTVALEPLEAEKALTIACALVRKVYNERAARRQKDRNEKIEEVWFVALNKDETDRSYLFGRALAYAKKIEELAQFKMGAQVRQTNAVRLQVAFEQHPARTWQRLYKKLIPYMDRVWSGYMDELHEVIDAIALVEFNDRPLEPLYLLGYSSQLNEFRKLSKSKVDKEEEVKP